MDDVSFQSSQGRSSNASSFHVSLLHVINGVVSVVLYPQVASQDPQHCISSAFPANLCRLKWTSSLKSPDRLAYSRLTLRLMGLYNIAVAPVRKVSRFGLAVRR